MEFEGKFGKDRDCVKNPYDGSYEEGFGLIFFGIPASHEFMVFLPIWKMIGFWSSQCYGLKRKDDEKARSYGNRI